jgi:hypothetical protein
MPATPITDPAFGESLLSTEPQLLERVDPGWRRRLNLFTGRALHDTELDNEQLYRGGLLTTLGQSVTAGTVTGLALTMNTSGPDPVLAVSSGYGIAATGEDVVLNTPLKTTLSTLPVIDPLTGQTMNDPKTGNPVPTFHDFVLLAGNTTFAGILILQPVIAQVSGEYLDTGSAPMIVSGNLGASCGQDPEESAFEDWQIADAVRLVFLPWPGTAFPLPPLNPEATWRNRLAYAIFEAESALGPDDQMPWSMLGVPVALIGFDPGIGWKATTAYTVAQFITDPSGDIQRVTTAGTSGGSEPASWSTVFGATTTDGGVTWTNAGRGWKPLFVDCSTVVRAGGLPRNRYVLPSQPPPLLVWQPNTSFAANSFIIDPNNNVQIVATVGTTGAARPQTWAAAFGQSTNDGSVTWKNNGPASWHPNTTFALGQFLYDSSNNLQTVVQAGTSGPAQPDWNGIYLPTSDGNMTWMNSGSGNPPVIQPALAQARVNQLSEQLSQTLAQQLAFNTLADIFPTLPPSGILPTAALNFNKSTAPWFPPNWSVKAAPVFFEELETVLQTGMLEALLAAESAAPSDPTQLEPVEVLVPLPDALYDPNILVQETVALIFQQEVDQATEARNLVLQQIETVQQELNTLYAALGPNVPANANLIDPNAGLTPDELMGRDAPPPYTPAFNETFGTVLQSTWVAGSHYDMSQFVVDGNGAIQVVQTAGTSGKAPPNWSTTVASTTKDSEVTWLHNATWAWEPSTNYVAGQFVVDPEGFQQIVQSGGTSAASPPPWDEAAGKTTSDGINWQAGGKAGWQADTQYNAGQLIRDSRGNVQIVQTAGISGDSAPSWNPNAGQTTTEISGLVWNNLGHSSWQPNTFFNSGQAIIDSNGQIQIAQIGGTSGTTAPIWNETANATTTDTAVIWVNHGPLIWQASHQYSVGQIIIDSHGKLQVVQTPDTSLRTQPVWNTKPGGTTADGKITWLYLPFISTDVSQMITAASQAPYTKTYTDAQNASHTINLVSADDLTDLTNNGLPHFIARLNAKISQANDLLDTTFLTTQTDTYRYRQNVLGATAATTLATSPILANIATGETSTATATNLQNYLTTLLPPPGSNVRAPQYNPPVFRATPIPVMASAQMVSPQFATGGTPAEALRTRMAVVKENLTASPGVATSIKVTTLASSSTTQLAKSISGVAPQSTLTPLRTTTLNAGTFKVPSFSPTQIIFPGQNINATTTDITDELALSGAQANIRTLTVAERMAESPSQEAMFYSISNRVNFLTNLASLETDLELTADDLQILVDGAQPASGTGTITNPTPVPVETHFFSEWLNASTQPTLLSKLQNPYLIPDSDEATLFSVGVRVLEQHTTMLRALEARVQQYVDFLGFCTTALNNIHNNIQQAATYLTHLQNNLLQDRQNVAFTASLLLDEKNRVQAVNAQRQQVLNTSVQIIAYTRARTLQATETVPSRQLVPANIASPVPACLQQSVSIPPELREIVSLLREAPVSWMPSASSQLPKLERPVLLQQLALSTQARAAQQLTVGLLPSSAAGEPGVYAPTISNVYSADQQVFRNFQTQRAAFQPSTLTNLSWSLQVATVQSVAGLNDLISSDAVYTEVSNAIARLIQQIGSVATCLYTRVSIALPIDRLAWAEYLRGTGLSVQLQSLAILPNWNQLAYTDRQQMQLLVDWLFQQIDISNSAATAFMSDVVRTAILLASDVPVDNIIPGNILVRTQPIVGGVIHLNLASDRISTGMFVNLYSGANLAARGVVSDLDTTTVSATITDVFTPGVHLETSDVAHFTTQPPQALALRPLFAKS